MTHVDVMQFDDLALHRIQGLRLSLKKWNKAELFFAIGFDPDTVRVIAPGKYNRQELYKINGEQDNLSIVQ